MTRELQRARAPQNSLHLCIMSSMRMRVLAILVAAGLALAACSGSSGRSATPPASEPAASAPATPVPTTAGRPAVGASWPTYHQNPARTGVDPDRRPLGAVRQAWATTVDGAVYAEPLLVGGRVLVATEHDQVLALDAATGRVVWRTSVGDPVPAAGLPCGNVDPLGVTSTPVADPAAGVLYVVAVVQPLHHELVTLDLATGRVRARRAVDPPGADPRVHNQRGALALSRGRVYVPYGGRFGDCGAYHGWVLGVPAAGDGPLVTYQVPTSREAGIWAPSGPAVGGDGSLYVTTGNAASTSSFDFGNSVVRLTPELRRLDWFTPRNWAELSAGDVDLGSVGPTLLGGGLVFQIGKEGVGYLLRADRLGGLGGEAFSAQVCDSAFGGVAYAPPLLFVPCTGGLVALRVDPGRPSFLVAWRAGGAAQPPIVSGGAVWYVNGAQGSLDAVDPASGRLEFRAGIGETANFATPAAGDGRVVVAAGEQVLAFRQR